MLFLYQISISKIRTWFYRPWLQWLIRHLGCSEIWRTFKNNSDKKIHFFNTFHEGIKERVAVYLSIFGLIDTERIFLFCRETIINASLKFASYFNVSTDFWNSFCFLFVVITYLFSCRIQILYFDFVYVLESNRLKDMINV